MMTNHWRIHVFLQVSPTKSAIPVIRNVATVHDFAEQVTKIFPGHLAVGLEVVVQHTDADRQVAGVERVLAVPSLRTELASFAHHGVEVAQWKQNAFELHFTSTHLQRILKIHNNQSINQSFNYTLWGIKNVAVNVLQQLLQILTDFDNSCIKLTRNE